MKRSTMVLLAVMLILTLGAVVAIALNNAMASYGIGFVTGMVLAMLLILFAPLLAQAASRLRLQV